MNTAGKVAIGVGVAVSMLGLAVALGKPKADKGAGKEGSSSPASPCGPGKKVNPARVAAIKAAKTLAQLAKATAMPACIPYGAPQPEGRHGQDKPTGGRQTQGKLPFRLSQPPGDGPVGVVIDDAPGMVKWAISQAKDLGAGNFRGGLLEDTVGQVIDTGKDLLGGGSAEDVLKALASMISDRKIGSVMLSQIPQLGQVRWNDLLAQAKDIPWAAIVPMVTAFLKSKGLT